jgi:O-antigen ligase
LVRIKLPLLFFPIAFAGNWQLSKKQWLQLALVFSLLIFFGTVWSLWQYLQNAQAIQVSYLKAKTLPTPLENDHVRFSWLVCMAVIFSVYVIEKLKLKTARFLLACLSLFYVAYLHILSARTGLFSLYIFGGLLVFRWLFSKENRKPAFLLLILILLMPLIAWLFFPTFQNRVRYIVYDFSYIKKDTYLQGANDGNRILSLKAGWNILQQHPLGVGAGDVFAETKKWYAVHVPDMLEEDKIYPASEWLIYGDVAGWPGFILFTAIMLFPLLEKKKESNFYWLSISIIAAFSFLFDIGLEVQFGVFIYLFVILCWWKWMQKETSSA